MSGKNSPNSSSSPPTSTTHSSFDLPCHQRSSKEMSASAAASAAAIALALDLKPKHPITTTDPNQSLLLQQNHHQQQQQQQQQQQHQPQHQQQHQQQKIKKLVRRNASDKLRLIRMVHDNPILWDSRLPNFKGAEEEKNHAWEQIGKEFNAPGRRVARAFKSLRESYRRELAHVKLMGNNFKPKWSLYDAMDFLRDVIRERKGGSHAVEHSGGHLGLNLSALAHHMTATVNNSITNNNNNNNSNSSSKNNYKLNSLHSSFNDSALNLSKCSSSLNVSSDDYYYFVKPELDLSNQQNTNPNANTAAVNGGSSNINCATVNIPPAHQQNSQHNDSRVTSTRNDSSNQNTTYDDLDNSSLRSGEDENSSIRNTALSHQGSDEVEELEAIDADFPYPLILNSNSPSTNANGLANKRKRKHLQSPGGDDEDDDDGDDDGGGGYEGQMLQQHRHLRAQQNQVNGLAAAGLMSGMGDMMPPPQTVREVLNSKFCGFISAKLNSMEDSEADNLMNKILMLLVQTQMTQTVNNSALAIPQNGQNDMK